MVPSGIIFDCDGTMLDSMGMWFGVFDDLARRHDTSVSPELREAMNATHLASRCARTMNQWLHLRDSDDAFVEEMYDEVRSRYATSIEMFPGCDTLLEELARAGVPSVVATGTRVDEVRVGLAAHGIEDYPKAILSCEDVGVGKIAPDVYRSAFSALGTPRESTWVIEDEPAGLVTARAEGFWTVCFHNDHDGRDPEELRPLCDLFVSSYEELSLALRYE